MRQQHNAPENLNEPEQSRYKIAEDHSTKADHLAREKEANQICAPFCSTRERAIQTLFILTRILKRFFTGRE